jgi:uncharacterized protein
MKLFLLAFLMISLFVSCKRSEKKPFTHLQAVPFTTVHLDDSFWAPKIEVNKKISIPSAFGKCEETGRMDNFALAGGLIKGEHQGDFPFDDTDVYKVLEGASYALAVQYDPKLDHYLDSLITLIGAGQEKDGYLYTCLTNRCERLKRWYGKGRWDRLNSHELYNCGHLYEAAVAHYQATGKRTLLNIALKNADLINTVFGPAEGQKKVPSGHPIIEMALVKLYRVTGEDKYLKLARFFIDETGKGSDGHQLSPYSQDHKPIIEQNEAAGHAVRFGYLYSGVTDVASIMKDDALMDATKRVWENVVSRKLYITGGIGSRAQGEGFGPDYELPNMTAYCETCASIANVYWNYRLFLSSGEAKYFDVLERALYNGVISGVSLSGDKFFYDNPLESVHNHERAPWFGCACCPGNITRFLASVPGYVYAEGENSVFVNLFASGTSSILLGKDTIHVRQQTRYPWEGKIKLIIEKSKGNRFGVHIRIPGWAGNQVVPSDLYHYTDSVSESWKIKINSKVITPHLRNGYVVLNRKWKSGDTIEVDLMMSVRKISTHRLVKNNAGKMAFQRGPLVYCFEDKDNQSGWMFDLFIPRNSIVKAAWDDNLLNGVVTLSAEGTKVNKTGDSVLTEPITLKAIPYYAWNNRGPSNMLIWMPDTISSATVKPGPSPADSAMAFSSAEWAPGLHDGFDPLYSGDTDKSYFYWWLRKGSEETVEYRFRKPVTLSESSLYWLNMDHYNGNYRIPERWDLVYLDKSRNWRPVETSDQYGLKTDCYNTVRFRQVVASAIRIRAKLQKDNSAGILEWRIR